MINLTHSKETIHSIGPSIVRLNHLNENFRIGKLSDDGTKIAKLKCLIHIAIGFPGEAASVAIPATTALCNENSSFLDSSFSCFQVTQQFEFFLWGID